eukprot:UN15920
MKTVSDYEFFMRHNLYKIKRLLVTHFPGKISLLKYSHHQIVSWYLPMIFSSNIRVNILGPMLCIR